MDTYAERLLGGFGCGEELLGSFEVAAVGGARRGPRGDHGKERMMVAAGDRGRGFGPVLRGVADRQPSP